MLQASGPCARASVSSMARRLPEAAVSRATTPQPTGAASTNVSRGRGLYAGLLSFWNGYLIPECFFHSAAPTAALDRGAD